MKLTSFCELYKVTESNLYTCMKNNNIKDIIENVDNFGVKQINEEFFIKRSNFKNKVIQHNQDFFYWLNEFYNIAEIGNMVNTDGIYSYLSKRLFAQNDNSILSYKLNKFEWIFYKFSLIFIRRFKKKYKLKKLNIEKILDKRM